MRWNRHCVADSHHVEYLPLFYCREARADREGVWLLLGVLPIQRMPRRQRRRPRQHLPPACLPAPARAAQGDGRVLISLFFLGWMGVLFWMMAAVAEDFLVPALEVRCAAAAVGVCWLVESSLGYTCAFAHSSTPTIQPPTTHPSNLLQFLAHWMRMAPDVAGVTLFAFASGAPDLFTQIAAVAAGGHVDQELAIR